MTEIVHETGYKDDYKVTVKGDNWEWSPTNKELFTLIDKWFTSEDHEFGDTGYGRLMPWYYVSMIMLGETDKALKAYQARGQIAKTYFEQNIRDHIQSIRSQLEELEHACNSQV